MAGLCFFCLYVAYSLPAPYLEYLFDGTDVLEFSGGASVPDGLGYLDLSHSSTSAATPSFTELVPNDSDCTIVVHFQWDDTSTNNVVFSLYDSSTELEFYLYAKTKLEVAGSAVASSAETLFVSGQAIEYCVGITNAADSNEFTTYFNGPQSGTFTAFGADGLRFHSLAGTGTVFGNYRTQS